MERSVRTDHAGGGQSFTFRFRDAVSGAGRQQEAPPGLLASPASVLGEVRAGRDVCHGQAPDGEGGVWCRHVDRAGGADRRSSIAFR